MDLDVSSVTSIEARFWEKVSIAGPGECWPWKAGTDGNGYGQIMLAGFRQYAHRWAYAFSHPEWDGSGVVRHKCDNTVCCNPYHLITGTHADNRSDCVARRRHNFGERNGWAQLSEFEVKLIRELSGTMPGREIAAAFGVSPQTIVDIQKRRTWKHL